MQLIVAKHKTPPLHSGPRLYSVTSVGSAYLVVRINGQVAHGPPELLLHGRIAEMRRRDLLEQRKAALRHDRHLRPDGEGNKSMDTTKRMKN